MNWLEKLFGGKSPSSEWNAIGTSVTQGLAEGLAGDDEFNRKLAIAIEKSQKKQQLHYIALGRSRQVRFRRSRIRSGLM